MKSLLFRSLKIDRCSLLYLEFPFRRMNLESDDTDNNDDILFDNDTSTDDDVHGKNSRNKLIEHPKKPSTTRKNF